MQTKDFYNYLIKTLLTWIWNIKIIVFTHPEIFWLAVTKKKLNVKYIYYNNHDHYIIITAFTFYFILN